LAPWLVLNSGSLAGNKRCTYAALIILCVDYWSAADQQLNYKKEERLQLYVHLDGLWWGRVTFQSKILYVREGPLVVKQHTNLF
jgi:hypothetical protein